MLVSSEVCNKYSDRELISQSLENLDFFSCIYDRYEQKLLRYIHRITEISNEEAQDVLQDAFIKVWKNLKAIDANQKLSSWLYRIVHNEVVSRWRKHRHHTTVPIVDENSIKEISAEDSNDMQEKYLKETIAHLPPKYQEVIVLKYFEDLSYEDISDVLKIPEGTVAVRLNRAKKLLHTGMDKHLASAKN